MMESTRTHPSDLVSLAKLYLLKFSEPWYQIELLPETKQVFTLEPMETFAIETITGREV